MPAPDDVYCKPAGFMSGLDRTRSVDFLESTGCRMNRRSYLAAATFIGSGEFETVPC